MNFFFFCAALFWAVQALAAPGLPMTTSPLSSGADLASRIEFGNGLAKGADYVSAFMQVRPEFAVQTPAEAVEVARELHDCSPTPGKYIVSRVKDGKTSTRVRHVSASESALCDDSRNVVILKKCGNVVRPMEEERVAVTPTPPVQICSWCKVAEQRASYGRDYSPAEFTEQVKVCEHGTECGAVVEVTKALIYGAAGVAGASLLPGTRIKTLVQNAVGGSGGGVSPPPGISPPGGGPVNPPEFPPVDANGNPLNPNEYWQ